MEPKSRLIDHLLVLGVDLEKERITAKGIQENSVNPTLLEIYPPTDKGTGMPRYLENCNLWGFENGFKLYDQNLNIIYGKDDKYKPTTTPNERNKGIETNNRMYSFVMTDEHYCKRYCTSLLFHEPYFLQNDDSKSREELSFRKDDMSATLRPTKPQISETELIFVPKSISVVSARPCFETQRMILKYIFGDLLGTKGKDYCDKRIRIPTRHLWNLGCFIKDIEEKQLLGQGVNVDWQSEKIFEYNRESHLKGLGKEEEIFVHESHLREFYFSAVFSLLDVPSKPMDKVVLKLHNEDDNNELIRYRIPKKNGIYLPETNYKVLLRRLNPKNIVRVFKYILLEKQIIFFSSRPEEIPYVTEAFLSLISPLSWCCLYVPFLPISMWEILHAVMPFIVGVSSRYKEFVANQIDLTDKIVVDLDDDALFIGEDTGELPKEVDNFLKRELEPICSKSRKADPKKSRDLWVEFTLKTRHIFNIALLAIVNNYLVFFKQTKDKKESTKNSASEVFLSEKYLAQFPSNDQVFMKEFSSSMVFINLIEESYRLIYSDRNAKVLPDPENVEEIATFIEQLKAMTAFSYTDTSIHHSNGTYMFLLHKKAIEHMGVVNYDSIKQASERYYNPEYIDLFPYLIKYYFKFFLSQQDRFKLLSSPMSFKSSSNPTSRHSSSPERSGDFINREIQYFNPLNKSRILDLRKIFSPPELQKPSFNNQINRNSDPVKSTGFSDIGLYTTDECPRNVIAPSTMKNSNLSDHEKRFSIESPLIRPVSEKIDVHIDYNQLAQLTSLDDTTSFVNKQLLKPARYSMPEDYDSQDYEIPRQNSNPVRINKNTLFDNHSLRSSLPNQISFNKQNYHPHHHHLQSMPVILDEIGALNEKSTAAGNQINHSFSKGDEKNGQIRWDIREIGEEPKRIFSSRMKRNKDEEELKLYNSLHIPRKEPDTIYRVFGRINTDDSLRLSLNNLDQTVPRDNRPLGRKNMVSTAKPDQQSAIKVTDGKPKDMNSPNGKPIEDQNKKKVLDEKDKFVPTADQVFVGKAHFKKAASFRR